MAVSGAGESTSTGLAVSHAPAVLLAATASGVGLDQELSTARRPWMRPLAVHNPGKINVGPGECDDPHRCGHRWRPVSATGTRLHHASGFRAHTAVIIQHCVQYSGSFNRAAAASKVAASISPLSSTRSRTSAKNNWK